MPTEDERLSIVVAGEAGLPYLSLDPRGGTDPVDPRTAELVPPELSRSLGFILVRQERDAVVLAVDDPHNDAAAAAVRGLTGLAPRLVIAPRTHIHAAHARTFGPRGAVRVDRYVPTRAFTTADTTFLRHLAASTGSAYATLEDPEAEVDAAAASVLGERTSRRLGVIGLSAEGDTFRIATAQPFDSATLRVVESLTGRTPQTVIVPPDRIAAALDVVFGGGGRVQASGTATRALRSQPGRRLGEVLVASGTLDQASVRMALAQQRRTGDRLGHILIALGYLRPEPLAQALAEQLRLPYVEPRRVRPVQDAHTLLPETLCRRHRLLPVEQVDDHLVVAMADPLDPEANAALEAATPLPLRVVVASDTSIAAGLERLYAHLYTEISTTELLRRRPDESAYRVLTRAQKAAFLLLLVVFAAALVVSPRLALIVVMFLSVLFYTAVSIYKFVLIYRTIGHNPELPVSDSEVSLLDERLLPRYTILVPLFSEVDVIPGLISALDDLDYPPTRLDIKLLLEADDIETIRAVRRLSLRPHYDVVIVPRSEPRTKPKACNYGLLHARGDYVVIFDAEDRPERDQLKKIVVAFRKAPPRVVCIQAKLNYWNREQNLLTRWFTTEYSQWFDLFLPGLDATGAPIPLGGTSNHFLTEKLLELGAWDPFNVTEDADVGIRLSRAGYRTATIDSTTYEEANSRLYNWIRQRSRWVKGYIQTWLVHMRHPLRLWRDLGPANFISFHLVVGGTFLTMLLNPFFWGLTTVWALTEAGLIQEIFPGIVYFAGGFNLLIGNFVFTYLSVAGSIRRGYHGLVKYALFSPLYWALMSIGAWRGLFQLITRPSYWEKTVHGLAAEAR